MRIIQTIHAKERMEQRNIKPEQVEEALRNPDKALSTYSKRRKRVLKKLGSKTLDVIYELRGKNKIVLVTAMWLEDKDRKVRGDEK